MKSNLSLPKEKIKIVLLEGIHPQAVDVFNKYGYPNVEHHATTPDHPEELIGQIGNAHIVGIRSRTQMTPEIIEHVRKPIVIGCFCKGTNQVALNHAARKGIPVFNAPHSNTRSVAELVIGVVIMLVRNVFPKSMAAHQHTWKKSASDSYEIRGKTLGIVGYGHIGSQVSVLAEALGMQVLFYDIKPKLPMGNARPVQSLHDLLRFSDIVTLHVPEDESTRNMINERALRLMKKNSALINTSRGSVVDIKSLVSALKENHLKGAAIDVFPNEPNTNKDTFDSPLIGMENVILTPHIGGATEEAQENIGAEVAQKLIYFSDRGSTEGAANFPMVNLSSNTDTHRILHIHQNKPGMLSAINKILANRDINVLAQHLGTNHQIGYVVLDIDQNFPRKNLNSLKKELKEINGTVRTRILY